MINVNHNVKAQNKQVKKLAIVTGGAVRIGEAIVRTLHQAGFTVLIHYNQSHERAHSLCDALNTMRTGSARCVQADLACSDSALSIVNAALDVAGRIDLLVNNASLFIKDAGHSFDASLWQRQFVVNVEAPMRLSLAAYEHLAAQGGAIINLTDIHATKPLKGYSVYCQTKAALWMQTLALAREFAPKVRVNAVAPGAIAWPLGDNSLSASQKEAIIDKTPLRQHGEPDYIARAVLDLANHPFITGQSLAVDGGRSIV